jgi:hypothetical protein
MTMVSTVAAATTLTLAFPNEFSSCDSHTQSQGHSSHHFHQQQEESRNFKETLQHHKRHLSHYKQSWNWHNANSRIPTVSWPLNIPNDSEVPSLSLELSFCNKRRNKEDSNQKYCSDIQFQIASHMLLQPDINIQKKAFVMLQKLAENSTSRNGQSHSPNQNQDGNQSPIPNQISDAYVHVDSICAYATCLNDGRGGIEPNPSAAVSWWKYASDKYDHIQSTYETGVALYTGEGVAEDEQLAVEYFRKAAESGHAGASYMLGDCLLDGVGVERDRGEALEWLVTAAELGHRGARSRVLAVLEKKEGVSYGEFTDGSRQSLIEKSKSDDEKMKIGVENDNEEVKNKDNAFTSGKKRDEEEKPYSRRPVTLEHRFTIGGGAKNPVVLARRKTIVTESRQSE